MHGFSCQVRLATERTTQRLEPIRHQLLKTAAEHLHCISPRVLNVETLLAVKHYRRPVTNLVATVLDRLLQHCLRIGYCQTDVEESATFVIKVLLLGRRVDKLEKLNTNAIAGRQPGNLAFPERGAIDLEEWPLPFWIVFLVYGGIITNLFVISRVLDDDAEMLTRRKPKTLPYHSATSSTDETAIPM